MDFQKAYLLILQKLQIWVRECIRLLPNILLAALVLTAGYFISRWVRKLAAALLRRFTANPALVGLFSSVVYVLALAITFFSALSILKLDKAVTSMLAGAGIIGLALAFAFQDIAANFVSGIFISFRHPIRVGHIVKIKDFIGRVEEINLRDTMLRTFQGQMVIIPNRDVFQNPIENFSLLGKRRYDLPVRVAPDTDLTQLRRITTEALKDIEHLTGDEPALAFDALTANSVQFTLRLWVDTADQSEYLRTGSVAIERIRDAYRASGIMLAG
jgi:small conductance mechanosensitive channel